MEGFLEHRKPVVRAFIRSMTLGFLLASGLQLTGWGQTPYNYRPPSSSSAIQNYQPRTLPPEDGLYQYSDYTRDAADAIQKGELSRAIDLYEKALTLSPPESLAYTQNNLAVLRMKRGNFFLAKPGPEMATKALSDFRLAYYLLQPGWPEGLERRPLHEDNTRIAKGNVILAYKALKLDPSNATSHLQQAKTLRLEGKFAEAVVEYDWALSLLQAASDTKNNTDIEAMQALGDLFNVLNKPYQAKKYYLQLAKAAEKRNVTLSPDVLSRLANAQNKAGQVNDAVNTLNKVLEKDPTNVSALNQLEQIWLREVRYTPNNVVAHANLASVFQKKKRYDDALKAYNAAEFYANRDPKTSLEVKKQIRLNVGTLYQDNGNWELALRAYDTVLQIDPINATAYYYKASALKASGRLPEAQKTYAQLLALPPSVKNPYAEQAHADLLALITQQPDPNKVAEGLKAYASQNTGNVVVQTKVAEAFHRLKAYPEAEMYYQQALALKPNPQAQAALYANLGAVYQAKNQPDKALIAFQKAHELDPNNQTVQQLATDVKNAATYDDLNKALSLQQAGQHAEALPLLEAALKNTPDNADARAAYGLALQNTGKLPQAILAYQQALSGNSSSQNALYQYYLATAYHQQKDYTKARETYQLAIQQDTPAVGIKPQAEEGLKLLDAAQASDWLAEGVAAYNQKQWNKALDWFDKVLQRDLQDNTTKSTAYYYQGLVFAEQKKLPEAISSHQKALSLNPQFKEAYYSLAVAYDQKGEPASAQKAFEQFIQRADPQADAELLSYAQSRLKALQAQ